MLKLLFPIIVANLITLLACTGAAPAPEATETPAPSLIAAAAPAVPANTPEPEATATSTARPTGLPTATSAPAISATPQSTSTPTPDGRLTRIVIEDSRSLQSALSEAELGCTGDDPEELARLLAAPGPESREEQVRLLNCLHDETLVRIYVSAFVPGPKPLSLATSHCVREALAIIQPRSILMAGIEGDPGRATALSMVGMMGALVCLNDEEWSALAPMTVMGQQDRAGMQCLMEELGGPGQFAEAALATQESHFSTYDSPEEALKAAEEAGATLDAAAAACEMKLAPGPGP